MLEEVVEEIFRAVLVAGVCHVLLAEEVVVGMVPLPGLFLVLFSDAGLFLALGGVSLGQIREEDAEAKRR